MMASVAATAAAAVAVGVAAAAAAAAEFSFCSRPADGAAPLKPSDVVRWMLALRLTASHPRPPVWL